jgi:hypothetical protein
MSRTSLCRRNCKWMLHASREIGRPRSAPGSPLNHPWTVYEPRRSAGPRYPADVMVDSPSLASCSHLWLRFALPPSRHSLLHFVQRNLPLHCRTGPMIRRHPEIEYYASLRDRLPYPFGCSRRVVDIVYARGLSRPHIRIDRYCLLFRLRLRTGSPPRRGGYYYRTEHSTLPRCFVRRPLHCLSDIVTMSESYADVSTFDDLKLPYAWLLVRYIPGVELSHSIYTIPHELTARIVQD